jgi:SAM-dependent methyltransferase
MGLDLNGTRLLLYASQRGLDLRRTAMLGRQGLHLSAEQLAQNLTEFGRPTTVKQAKMMMESQNGYCEKFLQTLGAEEILSFDFSAYEEASELHDFNLPIADEWHDSFTAVIDSGSLEHIFNFPVALRSCMQMVAPGGHFITITPANNMFGHGFYQFGPELFFRSCSDSNGFRIIEMIAYETDQIYWYEVLDPAAHGRPFTFHNDRATHLFVMARKVKEMPLFANPVQQGIYKDWVWTSGSVAHTSAPLSMALKERIPERLKVPLRVVRSRIRSGLGRSPFSEQYFRRVQNPARRSADEDRR